MKKRVAVIAVVALLLLLLLGVVAAQGPGVFKASQGSGSGDKQIHETIYDKLSWIGQIDLSKVGVENESTFWAKVIIWFAIFSIFYYVGSKFVFSDKPKFAGIIAALIAFMTVLIPKELFGYVFQTYSVVLLALLFGGPIVFLILVARAMHAQWGESAPRLYHGIMAILSGLMIFILNNLNKSLEFLDIEALFQFSDWIIFLHSIVWLIFLWHFVLMFFSRWSEEREAGTIAGVEATKKGLKKGLKWLTGDEGVERRTAKRMRKFAEKGEKSAQDVADGLKYVLGKLQPYAFDPNKKMPQGVRKILAGNIQDVLPRLRKEEAIVQELDDVNKQLTTWSEGRAATLNAYKAQVADLLSKKKLDQNDAAELDRLLDKELAFAIGNLEEIKKIKERAKEFAGIYNEVEGFVYEGGEKLEQNNVKGAYTLLYDAWKAQGVYLKKVKELKEGIKHIREIISGERAADRRLTRAIDGATKKWVGSIKKDVEEIKVIGW